jgi:type II secretory pathway component GspD/PulD (secretin)
MTFNVTTVSNTFSVKDGETVAIAGLIRDQNDISRSGVPFLSQIPLLGSLFGSHSRSVNRTELVILITPHVIRTVDRLSEMARELKDSMPHIRQLVDEHDQANIKEMEEARKARSEQAQKELKKFKPGKQTKPAKGEKPAASEEPKKTEASIKTEEPPKTGEPNKLEVPAKPEEPPKLEEPKKPN